MIKQNKIIKKNKNEITKINEEEQVKDQDEEQDEEQDELDELDELDEEQEEELDELDELEELDDEQTEDNKNIDKKIDSDDESISDDSITETEEIEYNETIDNDMDKITEENVKDDECIYLYDDSIDPKDLINEYVEVTKEDRQTDSDMTHYERIRILGIRTKQIIMGAKPMISYNDNISAIDLAKYELINKTTPLIIKRVLPNNSYELWKVSELNYKENNEYEISKLNDIYKNSLKSNNYDIQILMK
jgi:DNA-directed RNA polymerase subunit K/omega